MINDEYDIDEDSLDAFICKFDEEEPGRHPPVSVRRELLVEARNGCAICMIPLGSVCKLIYSQSKVMANVNMAP